MEKIDRDLINDTLEARELSAILMDGLDEGILGFLPNKDEVNAHIVYSREKCIQAFVDRDGMSHEEAVEFFEYNTVRALEYMPEDVAGKPIIIEEV